MRFFDGKFVAPSPEPDVSDFETLKTTKQSRECISTLNI